MKSQSHTQSSPELMDRLREPAALAALEVAVANHWLAVDVESLDRVFAAEPNHPARNLLAHEARSGGRMGLIQYGILSGFFALAFVLTIFSPKMPPLLFFMWGGLGVAIALMVKKYPGLMLDPLVGRNTSR